MPPTIQQDGVWTPGHLTSSLAVPPNSACPDKNCYPQVRQYKSYSSQENRVNLLAPNKGHFQEILPSISLQAHLEITGTGGSTI